MRPTLMTPEKLQARMRAGEQKRALEEGRNNDLYERWVEQLQSIRSIRWQYPALSEDQWRELDLLIEWLASSGRQQQAEKLNRLARRRAP